IADNPIIDAGWHMPAPPPGCFYDQCGFTRDGRRICHYSCPPREPQYYQPDYSNTYARGPDSDAVFFVFVIVAGLTCLCARLAHAAPSLGTITDVAIYRETDELDSAAAELEAASRRADALISRAIEDAYGRGRRNG